MNSADRQRKKMIVLGHDASRTGAPIFLLHLTEWLKRHGAIDFEIILKQGGPLLAEFQKIAPTTVLAHTRAERLIHRCCQLLRCPTPARFSPAAKIGRRLRHRHIDLAYANTVAVVAEAAVLMRLGVPLVWHIHELPFVINTYDDAGQFRAAGRAARRLVAAADCVQRGLVTGCGLAPEKISVIHEFAPPALQPAADATASRAAARAELNLSADTFVAGMCGTVGWRKGVDWFLAVGHRLAAEFPARNIVLVWIGDTDNETTFRQVRHEIQQARLTERVKFIGVKADSRHYLAALDAFLLSSREDPFPLAMLEAGSLGLPVVCFADSGGGPEFVGDDAGIIVPYADTAAAAAALVKLSLAPAWRQQLGATAREKVLTRYTLAIQAPKILRLLEEAAR